MPKLKPKKPLYPQMKRRLAELEIKTKPLFTKLKKPRPSIPQMYQQIKGTHASSYRRFGRDVIVSKKYLVNPRTIITEKYKSKYDNEGYYIGDSLVQERTQVPGRGIIDLDIRSNVRKVSRRGSGKTGGGGQLLGKGARKTGTAKARRMGERIGGTRGARPQREKKK